MRFWTLNAGVFFLTLACLAYKINYRLLPFALFSPITLLAIERGNVDAIVFFVLFLPLLVLSSEFAISLFIGFAAALKIYPIFGYIAYFNKHDLFARKEVLLGALLASPLMVMTAIEVPNFIGGTSAGFEFAYGLMSLKYLHVFQTSPNWVALLAMGVYILLSAVFVRISMLREKAKRHFSCDLARLEKPQIILLAVSLSVFLLTFLFFTNWSYRLVFLLPASFVLSNLKSTQSRAVCAIAMFIFWIPMFRNGWMFQNIGCYILAPIALTSLVGAIERIHVLNSETPPAAV